MHYQVKRRDKIVGTFPLFVDAWVFIALNATCFCVIIDSDGYKWIVNPRNHSIN